LPDLTSPRFPQTLIRMNGKNIELAVPRNVVEAVKGATLFDRDDPDSLFNRTQGMLHEAILRVETNKDARRIYATSERAIKERIKPEPRDARLRISFWDEYSRACERDIFMKVENIFSGICVGEVFIEEYIPDPCKMAYLMNIPTQYLKAAEEILMTGLERFRDILELPLINSKGQVQGAVINGILKAVDMLDKRVKGAVMQKLAIHQHTTSGGNVADAGGTLAHEQLAELEKQIFDVRKKINEKYAVIPESVVVVEKVSDEET
jgi:hypothetical protein